jgi:hypothetical protein
MTCFTRVMTKRLNAKFGQALWRVCLTALLAGAACSCQRSELAVQVDAAKTALQEQQKQLEILRREQGQSGTAIVSTASHNWHLQELQKRLADGRVLEAELTREKAELEQALKKLEAARLDYLKNHGGGKS